MNPILRNLISILRRFKVVAALNILGLSVAFAAFMVIMMQLDYDFGFDKFHRNYDRIYRLELVMNGSPRVDIPRPIADGFFESSPDIVAGAITAFRDSYQTFQVETDDGEQHYFKEKTLSVSPEFFDVFTFDFVENSSNAFTVPGNVFIPLSLSQKIFGNASAVGKQIGHRTVAAVYRDFPANSIFENYIYNAIQPTENKNQWGSWAYKAYFRINDASEASQLVENFKRNFDSSSVDANYSGTFNWKESGNGLRITALHDIYYVTDIEKLDNTPKANKSALMVLFAIAFIIIIIAVINFTNFSTALTPMRVKSINTQRVLGAQRSTLRSAIVFESIFYCLLSFLIAVFLVLFLKNTSLSNLIAADMSLTAHPLIVGGTALIALLAGLFAGIYPANYIISFEPALVLKGSFELSPKGKKIRNILIGVQYTVSFALMIGAAFMYLQNYFIQHSPLGYDRDGVIVVNVTSMSEQSHDALRNQMMSHPDIEGVSFGQSLLSTTERYGEMGQKYNNEYIEFQTVWVDYAFLKVLGIDITEGRDFKQDDQPAYIFNEAARKQYSLELYTTLGTSGQFGYGEIAGFISDVKYASLHTAVEPMAFFLKPRNYGYSNCFAYIKLKAGTDRQVVVTHIRSALAEFSPLPSEIRFLDDALQQLYEKEIVMNSLITLFSLIAIFISIVGVFGLVVLDNQCRRKEIGIRKINGASTSEILVMFNRTYFRILVICSVVAAPVAWYIVSRWLENFAYKTPLYWWVFLLVFIFMAVITAGTVSFQSWRVANDNPVNAIKKE
ncbi:MAG: FtsX-like permease family protein [Dysgonamonadaceae bacterium]|jgi:putative ABC transport system permease protein|nr:FtsX-like permease family protein [Dysgonamonadaceae bacterium]